MYTTNWFYNILVIITLVFIFRLIAPIVLPLLGIYVIYALIKNRQAIKTMKDLNKAKKVFKQEWDDVTQSQEYQSDPSDVIDADYTIKEE